MTIEGEKKIAAKAAELIEAIKEELQAEKREAVQFVHDVKAAAHDAVGETKEALQAKVKSAQENLHTKAEKFIVRKDEVVEDTAATLIKAIDHAKCALTSNRCPRNKAVFSEEQGKETDTDMVAPE